jgi:hypothetical protein
VGSSPAYTLLLVLFVGAVGLVLRTPDTAHRDTFLLLAQYGLLLPALVMAVRSLPRGSGERPMPVPPILLTLSVFLALNLAIRAFVTQDVAAGDESAYHFQARLFAQGMVAAAAPPDVLVMDRPLRSVFRFHHHVMTDAGWLSQYPPGWPALLSLAWRLDLDWLLNPLLGAWILLLTWRVGSLLYSPRTGALGAAIAGLSISFQHHTVGYLSHASCGALVVAATYFYLKGREKALWGGFFLSLVCLAGAILVRPYTGFCVALVLGALMLVTARRHGALARFLLLAGGIGTVCVGAYLAYNFHAHGGLSGYRAGGAPAIFVASLGDLVTSLATSTRWSTQTTLTYGLPFLLPLGLFALLVDREHRAGNWLLTGLFLALVVGYGATRMVSGSSFGERYYYEAYFALCLLAAHGLRLLVETRPSRAWRRVAPALVLCAAVYALQAAFYFHKASESYAAHVAVAKAARAVTVPNSVVFLPPRLGRETNLNSPDWQRAPAIYLEDPGERFHGPITAHLNRKAWFVIAYDPAARVASVAGHGQADARPSMP